MFPLYYIVVILVGSVIPGLIGKQLEKISHVMNVAMMILVLSCN